MAKIGRPTKYTEDMPGKVYSYIKECSENPQGSTREELTIEQLPLLCGLVKVLKANNDTISEWRKIYPLFSEACNELLSVQKKTLIQLGLSGAYNSTIAARILGANHGMSDKKDITTNGNDLPGLTITLAETIDNGSL
jgi:hypothetical protein